MRAQEGYGENPVGYLVAIIDEHVECDAAMQDLLSLGITADNIETFTRPEELDELRKHGDPQTAMEGGSIWARAGQALEGFEVSADDERRYEEAVRNGSCVLSCSLGGEYSDDRLKRILIAHGARFARLYGPEGLNRDLLE